MTDKINVQSGRLEYTSSTGSLDVVIHGDLNVKYATKNNQFCIEVDPDRGVWAPLQKEDVLFMAKKMGLL